MKRLRRFMMEGWQPILLYGIAIAGLVLLFMYKIGSLPAGLSQNEIQALGSAQTWQAVLNNPLYAPHKVLILTLQTIGFHDKAVLRGVSACWALITTGLFFSILKRWYPKRIAILGTLLFTTSTWYLITSRLLTPEILQSGVVILLAVGGWLRYSHARISPVLLAVGSAAILFYIPGMLWLLIGAAIWQWPNIKIALKESSVLIAFSLTLLFLILIGPLLFAIVRNPSLGRELVGLPSSMPSLQQVIKGFVDIPLALFLRAPLDPVHWLGHLPLLDIFSTVMFGLGLYSFYFQLRLDRAKLLFGAGFIISVLIALSGTLTLTMLLPLVYIVVAAGLSLFLRQWLTVFPRNPLARTLGYSLLIIVVLAACFYQVSRYYVAWQHTPATKQAYSHTL